MPDAFLKYSQDSYIILDGRYVNINVNVNVICLPTEHQGVHRIRSEMSVHSRIKLEFEKCWFLRRGENRSTWRKTSWSREENQQQTQPTYDAGSVN